MLRNTKTSYGSIAKIFHWAIFILVTFMLVLGYFMDEIDKPARGMVMNLHKLTGLLILLLMLCRLFWALMNPKPELPVGTKIWERMLSRAVHFTLYVLILAMPVAGWVMSSASGHAPFIGSFKMKLPIAESDEVSHVAMNTHNFLAIVIIILVSLHVLAALFHFFIKKDNVLQRMMPD